MKHVKNIAGMILIAVIMEFVVKPGEALALNSFVTGAGIISIDEWVRKWAGWASFATGAGLLAFLIWYLIGLFSSPDFSGRSSKRPIWIVLLVLPALTVVAGFFSLPQAQSFAWLAFAFLGFNALFSYWLVSAGFSPARVKTAPIGGEQIRRITDALPF